MTRPLPFTSPWLLAPMEGVTEPAFRRVVFALHSPDVLGGAFTEFVRVIDHPVPTKVLQRYWPGHEEGAPVGIQLMGNHLASVAETAAAAEEMGAPLIDLNFGCPAKGAIQGCAGSALLDDPPRIESIVRACVEATHRVPVTAKIRAGVRTADRVEDIARAVEAGGASLLTVHARTRLEFYCPEVDWTRIARAVSAVNIPVCGNGNVLRHEDLEGMRAATGAQFAMVGRGALADPWIFSGQRVTPAQAARFLLDYAAALGGDSPRLYRASAARVKQLLNTWTAGGLVNHDRKQRLRETCPERFFGWLTEVAGPSKLAPQ